MSGKEKKYFVLGGILLAVALAVFVSPFASTRPDGLERVAEDKGFAAKAETKPALPAPLPDYGVPGVKSGKVSTALAGLIGTVICLGAAGALGWIIKRKKQRNSNEQRAMSNEQKLKTDS